MRWANKSGDKSLKQDPIRANRAALLEAVDQTWLSGLLDHLLNQQESLKIGLEALEPDKLAKSFGGEPYLLTYNQDILQTFNDFGQKLVLLGEPGSGKTVLMLQLARLLWNLAKRDERNKIPMVFPLASWAAKQLPIEKWLAEELQNRYGISEKLARALVESEQVIFLLDGLDEVAKIYHENCLQAIKMFVDNKNRHVEYALCSRRKEFEALRTRLDVPGEIFLRPLTMDQIQIYLKKEPFAVLRDLLNTNHIVRDDFATIPFMLNTMAYVTHGKSAEGLRRLLADKKTEESVRAAFLDEYVTQRLAEIPNTKYSNLKTRLWLRWLANQLMAHDVTDFYLENMQPDWLGNKTQERQWRWIVGLIGWIVVGFIGGLLTGLLVAFVGGLSIGLKFGLGFGLGFGFVFGLASFLTTRINMTDQLRWTFNLSQVRFAIVGALVGGLVGGLGSGIVFGFGGWLVGGWNPKSTLRYRVIPGQGIWRSLWNGFFIMLVAGAVGGIGGGLMGELRSGLIGRLLGELGFGPVGGIIRGLWYGLMGGLVGELGFRLLGWLSDNVKFGLGFGLTAFLQHYVLRWMLARQGNLPFRRYDKFLDYANDLVILRKVGGGYRFTHDMLRQHLAGTSSQKVTPD